MNNIKDYDDEGFELEFDDETTPEEKEYFVRAYTNVNMVADRRIHCTCCDTHIGTAPSSERLVEMHPVLRVTQCIKCYRFYNSGEFEKGEDGSELYCRWCGQGGDVYCCSDCPYVFCKKCILRNLTRVALHDVTSNDNWKCFSCAPKILYHLRAQHWALVNFIAKQKKKIEEMSKKYDQDEIVDAMSKDVTQCCQSKKRAEVKKRKFTSIEIIDSDEESSDSSWSAKKRQKKKSSNESDVAVKAIDPRPKKDPVNTTKDTVARLASSSDPKSKPKPQPAKISLPIRKPGPKSMQNAQRTVEPAAIDPVAEPAKIDPVAEPAEIDCTPDLFSYLVNHSFEETHGSKEPEKPEDSVSSSTPINVASTSSNQPQRSNSVVQNASRTISERLAQPQVVRRTTGQNPSASQPVYHNYNGFRIDLNNASQQSTVRLPNGKVIHVRKQAPLNNGTARFSIQPSQPTANRVVAPPPPVRHPVPISILVDNSSSNPRPNMTYPPVQSMQNVRNPPPLVINAVNSGVQMPPLANMPLRNAPVRVQRPRYTGPQTMPNNHMNLLQAQIQMQQMMNAQIRPPVRGRPPGPQTISVTPRYNAPPQVPAVTAGPSSATGPSAIIPPSHPRVYANDAVGRARTQLERQIFNSMSICNQIEGKLKTLMNSNAYKNADKLPDIKELYIHLSYLFTYTNGRFQTVHDKCMEDMRRLGFKSDATSLSSGNVIDKYGSDVDEDDLEIVEPDHQTIDLDSDDERTPEKNKSKNSPRPSKTPAKVTEVNEHDKENVDISIDTEGVVLDISSSTVNVECDVDISALLQINMQEDDDDNGESLLTRMNDDVGIATPPDTEEPEEVIIENDLKLKSKVTVSLGEPVEKVYPDLVQKAMQKLKELQVESVEEVPDAIDSPDQSHDEIEKVPAEIDSTDQSKDEIEEVPAAIDSPDQSHDEIEANETDAGNEPSESTMANNDFEITHDETDKIAGNIEEPQEKSNEGESSVDIENNTVETPISVPDNIQDDTETEQPQVEAAASHEDADSAGNEATSTECKATDDAENMAKSGANQESHHEITSTSTAIENDVEIHELDSNKTTDDDNSTENDVQQNVSDDELEPNLLEPMPDPETAQENNDNESIFSDLSSANQLINEEYVEGISTSEILESTSFLNNDDFENISSPDTFN